MHRCISQAGERSTLQVFLTRTHLAIVMEYAQGGDLFRYVLRRKAARLAEPQARWLFQQMVIALDFCHRSVRTPFVSCLRLGAWCMLVHQKPFQIVLLLRLATCHPSHPGSHVPD